MATAPVTAPETAAPAKRTRKAPTGPRKISPVQVVYRAVDAEGKPVANVSLEVALTTKDKGEVLDFMDAHEGEGYKRTTFTPSKAD